MKMYFLLANLGICSSGGVGGLGLSGPLVLPCSRAGLLSPAWPREGELCPGLCPAEPWPQGSSAPQRSALLCRLCCGKQAEESLSAGWHRHGAHYMAGGRDWQSFFFFFTPDLPVSVSHALVLVCGSEPSQVQLTCYSVWAGVPIRGGSPHRSLVPLQLSWDRWTPRWLHAQCALGPGQSLCCHQPGLCACSAPRGLAVPSLLNSIGILPSSAGSVTCRFSLLTQYHCFF